MNKNMEKILFSLFILLFLSCSQIDVKLSIHTKGHWKNNEWVVMDTCIVLTSKDFWVDQVWVADIIEEQGGNIFYADWIKVCFTIDGNNYDGFIEKLKPRLIKKLHERR